MDWAGVVIAVQTDVMSAVRGLMVEFSENGTTWYTSASYTVRAGAFSSFGVPPIMRYFRISYTNGAAAQASFLLMVQLRTVAVMPSTNSDGFLQVSAVGHEIEVPEGEVEGHYPVNKFGSTNNADQSTPTDVWDRSTQPIWLAPTAPRIHALASNNDNDGKTAAPNSTGARTVQIFGLQTWDDPESSEIVTLDGTTPVNTLNSYVIIHRMKVVTFGSGGPNIGTITATAADDATVTAQIVPLEGQTSMAIYGVPSTQSLYLASWYSAVDRDSPAGAKVKVRLLWAEDVENQPTVFTNKMRLSMSIADPPNQHPFLPHNGFSGPGILKVQVTADSNDTICDGGFDGYVVDK
jgi:hypothetical protein